MKLCFKPKFHYADFHQNFLVGKVVDTNHEKLWTQMMTKHEIMKFRWKWRT